MPAFRRRLAPAAVLALALAMLAPGFVAAAGEEFEGTLVVAHGDDFDASGVARGRGLWDYRLVTPAGELTLAFEGGQAPEGFWNGARVRVHGSRAGAVVAVGQGKQNAQLLEPTTVAAASTKNVALLLVNFAVNPTAKPWTVAQAQGIMFSNANSIANYFGEESYGQLTMTGKVLPEDGSYLTISSDPAACNYLDIASKAKAEAANRGISLTGYTNIQYAFPSASCGWAGLAYLPGTESWINNALNLRVSSHELGHNFGVHHASTVNCVQGGVRVALSSNLANCTYSEYGDPFTVMGSASTRHTHSQQLTSLGWLSGSNLQTVTSSGTYALGAAEDSGPSLKAIRVARGDGTYLYLELRQPFGTQFDNFSTSDPAVNGVSIRIAADWTTRTQSKLIDTTPATTSFGDAPLAVGATFGDPVTGVTIRTASIAARVAQVEISWGGGGSTSDTTPPTAPGSLSAAMTGSSTARLTWTASTDNVGVTGYRVSRGTSILGTVTTTHYDDSGLAAGATYDYSVVALDAAGNASPAATTTLTVPEPDTLAPSAPANFRVASTAKSKVTLAWDAAVDNVGVAGYRIYRDGVLKATTAALTWTDTKQRKTVVYTVVAYDAAGNVGPAATLTVATSSRSAS